MSRGVITWSMILEVYTGSSRNRKDLNNANNVIKTIKGI